MPDSRELLSRSNDQSFEDWLAGFLGKVKGEKPDIVAAVYREILSEKEPARAFQFFLQNADDITSTKEQEIEPRYTAAEIQKLKYRCTSCVNGILDSALRRNVSEDEFYDLLWNSITDHNRLLPEEDDVIFAIYLIWQDGRIPYFQLEEGLRMTNESFFEATRKNVTILKKAAFILRSSLEQRTEVSALLLKLLSECETEEDKAVVLAQILAMQDQKVLTRMSTALH